MPRIVPIQLLRCLKVLLNLNGGILSQAEVKRISCLMSKYSKKLVSKCVYVHILKCTDTELLDEFMRVGGWTLVLNWLNDGIRLSNWPLVQETIELLLLCPVDVNRLKTNSAPKTVKGLSINGGTEAVRILADRLVKQWLKVVTEGNEQARAAAAEANSPASAINSAKQTEMNTKTAEPSTVILKTEKGIKMEQEIDPIYVPEPMTNTADNLTPTMAQKKGMKSGLVYKIVVKDGQQLLTKVDTVKNMDTVQDDEDTVGANNGDDVEMIDNDDNQEETKPAPDEDMDDKNDVGPRADILEEDSTSFDKTEDKYSSESSADGVKKTKERKTSVSSDTKVKLDTKYEHDHERKNKDSKSGKEHKSHDKEKEHRSSASSSGHHRSSSSHKSSSKSTSSSLSSSSKSKSTSSSSSSSHRSSSDKHRSDKERNSSSSKDKDRSSSSTSSSSKHKSSSKSSSSSSSKDRHRDKEKSSSSLPSKKEKEREKEMQAEKDKDTLAKMLPPSLDKLGKIPKKPREDREDPATGNAGSNNLSSNKPTSITIPSKKASISIEIRRDTEKSSAVKTYKSQFRSHGLTEEAPPPPSRKTLKKPATQPGTVMPTSLPSSLKRTSPPPKDVTMERKQKIDVNNIAPAAATASEKPGAIKLIPPKRIQTLVETNLFSDALSAATGPKKVTKRKRLSSSTGGKDEPTTPTSPDAAKVAPLKFYQDTLDESAKSAGGGTIKETKTASDVDDSNADVSIMMIDDDDDIPLKKVKEDIEQRVRNQKKADGDDADTGADKAIELSSDGEDGDAKTGGGDGSASPDIDEVRKPGPGCGPNGPPGVLMLHRRKGPKKKLTWRPQETLEQIRYFDMDENERVNVMKVSFLDMKNMERFNERASLTNLTKRGPRPGDNQEPRTEWRPLIEIDDVPEHPDGAQSKERKVQADREMTTLRALYFSPNMIPDSASEAELEPHSNMDPPTIPLDDITGNPDAVNDFSGMPWPEPKGAIRSNEVGSGGTGGLGSLGNAADMFGVLNAATVPPKTNSGSMPTAPPPSNPFSNFMHPYGGNAPVPGPVKNMIPGVPPPMQISPNGWQGPPPIQSGNMMGNPFQGPPNPPDMMMGSGPRLNFMGPQSGPGFNGPHPGPGFNGPPPIMVSGSPPYGPPAFMQNGPNFGPMGPGGPPPMMNSMGPGPGMMNGPRGGGGGINGPNIRNNPNWIHAPPKHFRDKNDSWRPAGSGNSNNGVCKAYMRGNCSIKNCKYIHPKTRR